MVSVLIYIAVVLFIAYWIWGVILYIMQPKFLYSPLREVVYTPADLELGYENVVFKSRFKKDLKKLKSSNRDEDELLAVIAVLANEQPLDEKFRAHTAYVPFKDSVVTSFLILVLEVYKICR